MQIGEILKEARERNHLSLDDIQEETKIQKRYLVAIEQEDYHALPGKFYARAFIKEYAQVVGIDPTEILQEFDEENIQTEDTMQYTRMERSKRPKVARGSSFLSFLPSIIVIILVIGIIFVAWSLYQKALNTNDDNIENEPENDEIIRNIEEHDDTEEEEAENEETEEDGQDAEDTEEQAEGEFSVVEEGSGNSPLSTLDFTYNGDQVDMTLESSEPSYVQIKREDESVLFEGTVEPDGDENSFDLTDESKVYLNIGNVSGLTVVINDVEMEYPIDTDTVHQKFWINLNKSE